MKSKVIPIVIILLLIIGAVSVGLYYRLSQSQSSSASSSSQELPSLSHVAILLDSSNSMIEDKDCATLGGLISRAFNIKGTKKGSKIIVMASGSPVTAMEPYLIASVEIPFSNRVMEGKGAIQTQRKQLLLDVISSCKEKLSVVENSPIFLATKRALEQLQSAGCRENSNCILFVRTDGQETEEPWFKESLKRGKMLKKGIPAPLNNKGIKVIFCGFSETRGEISEKNKKKKLTGKRNATKADLLNLLWKSLFSNPEDVIFEPVCPKENLPSIRG